jgi:rSAM/selenodomain-associated transferase 1
MKNALIIFIKAPVAGTVKTRLQADLPKDKVVAIYKSFVVEIASSCARMKGIDRFLGCAPSKNHAFIKQVADRYSLKTFNQRGSDLGKKIINAFKDYFKKGYTNIVIIGSDSPTIPKDYIRKAFHKLEKNDFVVGPCCDGGMYLVGAHKKIEPKIFQKIPWDTSGVLRLILQNLFQFNIKMSLLPFWYDVDNIDDLNFLKLHLKYLNKQILP